MITEEYTCSKCDRIVVASPRDILIHEKLKTYSLPTGFVYKDLRTNSLGIVSAGLAGIESGLDNNGSPILVPGKRGKLRPIPETHGCKQRVIPYLISRGEFLDPVIRNAKEIVFSYKKGDRTVPSCIEFADFRRSYARYHENKCNGNFQAWELLRDISPERLFAIFVSEIYGVRLEDWNEVSKIAQQRRAEQEQFNSRLPSFGLTGLENISHCD